MKRLLLAAVVLLIATPAYARFDCGRVQRAYYHLPERYNLALNWADLPHTSPQPGAVVVQRRAGRALGGGPGGHVSRIQSVVDACHAMVTDEKGTYLRDICKNRVAVVMPSANHYVTNYTMESTPNANVH